MKKYQYQQIPDMDYQEWADTAYKDGYAPLLPKGRAERLECIFGHQGEYTPTQHEANLVWLEELELELAHIWTFEQRKASGMSNLVGDYKARFEL